MAKKIGLNRDGIVSVKREIPPLKISPITSVGKKLVRVHRLLSGEAPTICIIRGEGIGDLLMATPIAKFLKTQYPGVSVTFATNFGYLDGALPASLQNNPFIDFVINWDKIDQDDYDVVVNLGGGSIGVCPAAIYERPLVEPLNRIDIFARHLGLSLDDARPIFVVADSEVVEARKLLVDKHLDIEGKGLLLVNPYASNRHRSPDPFVVEEAIRQVRKESENLAVVVTTHSTDWDKDVKWTGVADVVLQDVPVRMIAAIMSFADAVVCPDSAVLHIAGALGVPGLALFGPTDPRARVNHYPNILGYCPGMKLHCWPGWYSCGTCSHRTCWALIKANEVARLVLKILGGVEPTVKGGGRGRRESIRTEII